MEIEPDPINLTLILKACSQSNNDQAVQIGKKLLRDKFGQIKSNLIVLNTAIDMLMTFSHVEQAEQMFEQMNKKDIFTYGSMIKGNS